ncbi:MAG: ribose 5-phosphate isomerase B [Firmicutes bacterium]|nr:ribose 5-phosphate isomerase B [Bacillota bacterium]
MKPIVIACDHAGFELKEKLKAWFAQQSIKVEDVGTNSAEPVDYPVIVKKAVDLVRHYGTKGIFVCGSGVGISIAANRYKGIRAVLTDKEVITQLSRQHNDANVLCLGGRFITFDEAKKLVQIFFETPFIGQHHQKRVQMLDA